jgi:hypothetical protein
MIEIVDSGSFLFGDDRSLQAAVRSAAEYESPEPAAAAILRKVELDLPDLELEQGKPAPCHTCLTVEGFAQCHVLAQRQWRWLGISPQLDGNCLPRCLAHVF